MRPYTFSILGVAGAIVMFATVSGIAATEGERQTGKGESTRSSEQSSTIPIPPEMLLNASTVIGISVMDKQGKEVGSVKELMIDHNSGQIAYAVISHGGTLGFGASVYAVPWNDLKLSRTKKVITLETDIESYAPERTELTDQGEKGK